MTNPIRARKTALSGKRVDEQADILENDRIGGAPADSAAPPVRGDDDYRPAPSFRYCVAIEGGVEAAQ